MKSDELEPTQDQAVRIIADAGRLPTARVGPHLAKEELEQLAQPGLDAGIGATLLAHIDSCPKCADAALEVFRALEDADPEAAVAARSEEVAEESPGEEDDEVASDDWDTPDPQVRELARLLVAVREWPNQGMLVRGPLRTRGAAKQPPQPKEPSPLDRALQELDRADDRVRRDVVSALGEPGSPGSLAALRHLSRHDREPSIRSKAADALARIGGANAIWALREATTDAVEEVRADAVDALGALLVGTIDGSERSAIRDCLRRIAETDLSPRVRERAAQLL